MHSLNCTKLVIVIQFVVDNKREAAPMIMLHFVAECFDQLSLPGN